MEKSSVLGGLAALSQETRLDIFRLLVEAGPAGRPAGEIGAALGLPAATSSFHLKELRRAGLISCRRDGRSLIYAADFAVMNGLVAYLSDNCCGGACAPSGCRPSRQKETAQ